MHYIKIETSMKCIIINVCDTLRNIYIPPTAKKCRHKNNIMVK